MTGVQQELAEPGERRLPPSLRSQLESAYGGSLDHISVDTATAWPRAGARAAAYGSRLYLRESDAAGATLDSQAVIAHEVAHTLQQGRSGGGASVGAAEHDADHAAVGAVLGQAGGRARPSLTTPLRLSRCPGDRYGLLMENTDRIRAAAIATGNRGITPKLLAAVLWQEIYNRSSPVQRAADRASSSLGGDPSLGLGQIRASTALMAEGRIPLISATAPTDPARVDARRRVDTAYAGVGSAQRDAMFERLQIADHNIVLVARWLAMLKNRPNRYREMSRHDFGYNQRACEIVASEYQAGPTDTREVDATPTPYGRAVWADMDNPHLSRFGLYS